MNSPCRQELRDETVDDLRRLRPQEQLRQFALQPAAVSHLADGRYR
jgi:hypothetical protein